MSTLGVDAGQIKAQATSARPVTGLRANIGRILRQRSAVVGLVILAFLFSIAILANFIAPYGEKVSMLDLHEPGVHTRDAPCIHILGCPTTKVEHLFGLDGNARDEFSRVVYGSRVSLLVGFTTVVWSIILGMAIGAIAGYLGGWVDSLLMRLMDMLLAFPTLLLAIVIVTVLGKGLTNAMLAIGIVAIPVYARVMRSSVLTVREQDYVTAARALGDGAFSNETRRVMPNAITPIIVQGTLGVGTAVLEVAALSFIGLTAIAPNAEWGSMIGQEYNQIFTAPLLVFIPGVFLTLTVLGFNLLGDGLRDAFDPRLAR
jgi:ABC-type dipeptide/oligopeptide/nickel transport system permease subunit